MSKTKIPVHGVPDFRRRYMKKDSLISAMLAFGFERFFIVQVEDMLGRINLPVPPMRADGTSIILLTSGNANMQIGGEHYQIFKNECLIVPAGQVFSFQVPDENSGYLLHFRHDFLTERPPYQGLIQGFEFLQVWGNPVIQLLDRQASFVHSLAAHLLYDYQKNGLKNAELFQAHLSALLFELKIAYRPRLPVAHGHFRTISNQFQDLLRLHFKSLHRVSDYARLLSITPNHLNKSVKNATGKSPSKWIDDCLVLEAKVLLCQNNLSIGEIAAEIGMTDTSYFSRFFKKMEGLAPLAFRQKIDMS